MPQYLPRKPAKRCLRAPTANAGFFERLKRRLLLAVLLAALGGLLVDAVFEPVMATQSGDSLLTRLFGAGKGSGAAFLFAVLWLMGVGVCLLFRGDPHIWTMDGEG